jgi:hypothetical protein
MRTSSVIIRNQPNRPGERRPSHAHQAAGNSRELAETIRRLGGVNGAGLEKFNLVQQAFAGIESSLGRLIPRLQGFGSTLHQLLGNLVKSGVRSLLGSLTGGGGARSGGGIPGIGGGGGIPGLGGAGGFGALGSLFTNPWTAVVAGGIVGGMLLARAFSNRTEKKLREAIQSNYGVAIRDMSVLRQIKEVGEQAFGRGQVSRRLLETIKLDQAKELIANYAESTGQTARGLTSEAQLRDPSYAGNRFVRESAGAAYGGGEPPKGGTQSAGLASRGGVGGGEQPPQGGTQSAGLVSRTIGVGDAVNTAVADGLARLNAFLDKIAFVPAGHVVTAGAGDASVAIANAAADGYERSYPARKRSANKTGR